MTQGPLHRRIREEIAGRILSGEWPPGRRIPSEHELMAHYGCARMTVNRALAPLAEAGLIVRNRRAGSVVARPRIHSVVLDIPDIQAEVTGRGEAYRYELLEREIRAATPAEAASIDVGRPLRVAVLACRHWAAGRPFALEERIINLRAVPEAETVDFRAETPGGWLLSHVPWTQAEHRISAVNVTRGHARLLEIAPQTACLALERRTWRGEDRITHVRLLFPGDAYDLVARFEPHVRR